MPPRIYFKDKICLQCNKKFNRGKLKSGRNECPVGFRIRKFCSHKCFAKYNSGKHHWLWKGGIGKNSEGYLQYNANKKFIHRIILEKYLGKKLKKSEVTHHINGIRTDNRIKNLMLMTNSEHRKLHVKSQKRNRYGFCK